VAATGKTAIPAVRGTTKEKQMKNITALFTVATLTRREAEKLQLEISEALSAQTVSTGKGRKFKKDACVQLCLSNKCIYAASPAVAYLRDGITEDDAA
jgi:hypothetical protein